jgi:hypothetical protein
MAIMSREQKIAEEKRLMERWSWLTEGVETYEERLNTSIVLENSYDTMLEKNQISEGWLESVLNEETLNEAPTTTGAVGTNVIPKVLFPMIRRVFPKLISNQLVSVQPITGPTGVVYYIVYSFSDTKGGITSGDEYSALPQQELPAYATYYSSEKIGPFTATIAGGGNTTIECGTELSTFLGTDSSDFSIKRIEVYSTTTPNLNAYTTVTSTDVDGSFSTGSNVSYDANGTAGTAGDIVLLDENNSLAPWTDGEEVVVYLVYNQENSTKVPEMEFSVSSDTVTTTERKLKIRWTKESEQDMRSYHKIDVESELVKVASMEMNYEIDREVLTFISDSVISSLSFTHDWTADAAAAGNNTSGNFLDRHRALAQKLYQVSAKIAQYNRQGPASWMVVSPQVASVVNMLPDFKGEISGGTFNVFEAGQLGSGMKVYVDPNRHGASANEVLLGYKSSSSTYGAGVVYAPYTNWMSPTVTHPESFNSIRGFFSRYAVHLVERGQYHYAKVQLLNFGL